MTLRAIRRRPWTSRNLWLLSMALYKRGHKRLARVVRSLNTMVYRNILPMRASVQPDVKLVHQAMGSVIHYNVTIGHRVTIHQNVTVIVRPNEGARNGVVIEDDVAIGAGATIITPRHAGLRIGARARIGAGAIVTSDVPADTTAVSPAAELKPRRRGATRAAAQTQ